MSNSTTTTSEMPNTTKDSTGWITANPVADFLLMYSAEIRYLCMFAYCFLHGKNQYEQEMNPDTHEPANIHFSSVL